MPAPSISLRVLAGSRVLVGLTVVLLLATGCQTIGNANQVIGRADLVNDLAARLDDSWELTYSAEYQLADGQTAMISQAHRPSRAAYTYPGGKVTVTAEATTECDLTGPRPTCTLTIPPSPRHRPAAAIFTAANTRGMVTPAVVISLLTAAALDTNADIQQSDTTIAGRHATCVKVSEIANAAASSFDACITTEGVLGSFNGVVNGTPANIVLSSYREDVDDSVFELPDDAGLIDQRPTAG
ncbi:MAG TPA: hypothetical protein VFX61_15775 [Micromonosporaceae bacterium]|nr:hypothetical protein [Micromonosporaceae bacterium]